MSLSGSAARIGIVAAVLLAGAGFYIVKLHSDLGTVQQEVVSSNDQSQKLRVSLDAAQKEAAGNAATRDQLQTQVSESTAQISTISAQLEQAQGEAETAMAQLAQVRSRIAANGQVAVYWRELFDYTKDFNGGK